MKKLIPLLLIPFLALPLASCDKPDEKTIVITDKYGNATELTLKKGEGDQEVVSALAYALKADYSKIDAFNYLSTTSAILKVNQNAYLTSSITSSLTTSIKDKYFNFNGNINLDTNLDSHPLLLSGDLDLKVNSVQDPNLYITFDGKYNGNNLNKKGYISLEKLEIQLKALESKIQELIGSKALPKKAQVTLPSLPTVPGLDLDKLTELKDRSIDELISYYQNIKAKMTNSKFEVDSVNKNYFIVDIDLSLNDILKVAFGKLAPSLEQDVTLDFEFKFNTETALLASYKVKSNLIGLVKELASLSENKALQFSDDCELTFANESTIKYGDVEIKRLTQEEKKNYEDLTKVETRPSVEVPQAN